MTEKEIIEEAFEKKVGTVCDTFLEAFMTAKTPEQRKSAEERFCTGITTARAGRDRALAILPA